MAAHDHGPAPLDLSGSRSRRLWIALVLNVGVVVAQVVLGAAAGSLGLLSDAGHNLVDVAALALSLVAVQFARRAPTFRRSYGWHRSTILAAQANAAMILLLTIWIVVEGVRRLSNPPDVEGGLVLAVALIAFAVNALAAAVVHERRHAPDHDSHEHDGRPHAGHQHGGDLNMRSAVLHLASDAAASLGVAAAGAVILATGGWQWLDPAVSLVIALSIAWHAWRLLRQATAILLEGTPEGIDPETLTAAMADVDGVEAVHDLHVWTISSSLIALSAHVVVEGHPTLEEAQVVGGRVRHRVAERFGIGHATLELECESCEDHGPACDIAPAALSGAGASPSA